MEENYINNENPVDGVIYEVSPHFNILYELFMPTGRKIKSTLLFIVVLVILAILLSFKNSIEAFNVTIIEGLTLHALLQYICYIALVLCVIKLIFHIVFQYMQYKHISYRFYDDHMVYEDDFLNQHRKNIEYQNIKEVEIRRTVWDRIVGYGVIVIYTNAENKRNNGLVVYGLRDPKASYEIIYDLVHKARKDDNSNTNLDKLNSDDSKIQLKDESIKVDETKTTAERIAEFNESIKKVNKE